MLVDIRSRPPLVLGVSDRVDQGLYTVTWCGRLNFSIALPPRAQVIGDFKESFDQTCACDLLKFPNYYY